MYYLVIPAASADGLICALRAVFPDFHFSQRSTGSAEDVPLMLWNGPSASVIKGSRFIKVTDELELDLSHASKLTAAPFVEFFEYDASWSYELHLANKVETFYTDPSIGPFKPEGNPPNAAAFEEMFGVPVKRIERYLRVWDWEMIKDGDELAYQTDDFPAGEWQQVEDFIKVLIGGITDSYALEITPI